VQSLTPARRYAASNRSATILSMRAEFPTSVRASRMRFRVRVKYSPSFNGTAAAIFSAALSSASGYRLNPDTVRIVAITELTASKRMRAGWR